MKISYDELCSVFYDILIKHDVSQVRAKELAKVFADNTAEGVSSHGVNRFPRFISYIEKKYIDINAEPECIASFGGLERWDGHLGFGPINARICMDRACDLAKDHSIGAVALRNTNHWMRGGTYGWLAARRGCIGICWTNTMPHMPVWGGMDQRIGNNPFVLAIPRSNGAHIVFDCSVAQYANGKIENACLKGQKLQVPGGYDSNGQLTTDPTEIQKTGRVLPMGYWKGSGLSIVLDLIVSILAGGKSVTDLKHTCKGEYSLCQMMIAIDPSRFSAAELADNLISRVIDDIKGSRLVSQDNPIVYPGERVLTDRHRNLKNGIDVVDSVWAKITALRYAQ